MMPISQATWNAMLLAYVLVPAVMVGLICWGVWHAIS